MKPKVLTPEKAGRELARVMEQVRREREELADATKERKGHIAALEGEPVGPLGCK